jgi:hypothetical protein
MGGAVTLPDLSSAGVGSTGAVKDPNDISDFVCNEQIKGLITAAAKKYDVPARLIASVMKQESGFNAAATSGCGAQGLMQLMPPTAAGLGVTNAYDPAQAVDGGTKLLAGLLKKYNGNVDLTLAAYNAGPGAVAKYGNTVPPYKETTAYVQRIKASYTGNASGGAVSAKTPDPSVWTANNVPQYEGSPYGVLPAWWDELEFILKVPDNARSLSEVERQLKDQLKRQTGKDVPDSQIEQYLRARYGASAVDSKGNFLAPALDSNGNFAAGTEIRVPHLSDDGLQLEDKPPYDLHPPDTRPLPAGNPALAGQLARVPLKG